MTLSLTRKIFKQSTVMQSAIQEALVFIFAQELLAPSQTLFLITPWISDIVVFANGLGQFSALNPDWGKRDIRLAEVLVTAAANGTHLRVLTRPKDANNIRFERRLKDALGDAGLSDALDWQTAESLHSKGLLTDRFYLDGSMNLTERGVHFNDETVTLHFEPRDIAEARVHFEGFR